MARRKESGFELLASMPWPVPVILGVIGFVGVRYGIRWFLGASQDPLLQGFGRELSKGAYTPFAWMVLALCWFAAIGSFIRRKQRRHLLEVQTGLDSVRALTWRQFEMLVGEAFRRDGYTVEENTHSGADGGIDLMLRKDHKLTLVQCKQWRTQHVDVKVVREMYGLLMHHRAAAVKIVAIGDYTSDARRFAYGKPVELISGDALLDMVLSQQVQDHEADIEASPNAALEPSAPSCPKCGSVMEARTNRRTNERFWGCANYPKCRDTRQLKKSHHVTDRQA